MTRHPVRGRIGRALLDALFVSVVTFVAVVTDPLHHRAAWMFGVLALAGGIAGAVLSGWRGASVVVAVLVGAMAAVPVWLLLLVLAALVVEWPAFFRSAVVFRHQDAAGRAVARVSEEPGRSAVWRVSSVTAWPRGGGRGTALMREVLRAADRRQRVLELVPSTRRIQRWYLGLGFSETAGRRLRRAPGRASLP